MEQPERTATLLFGEAAAEHFGPAIAFYQGKGLVKRVGSLAEAAHVMGVPAATVAGEVAAYQRAALGEVADPLGKQTFPFPPDPSRPLYLATISPVVHYTMGGVAIDADGRALDAEGSPISGLFAAGEVTGGVHGANRLAGNSLLDCVVFGQRAGHAAAKYVTELGSVAA
jgi:succinate dehydrogenase/fumarate reductase flavoprotein subunit